MEDKQRYHYINSQTGNIIAYFTIPEDAAAENIDEILEAKRKELAVIHKLFYGNLYWELEKE